jgi:hypothetical protein
VRAWCRGQRKPYCRSGGNLLVDAEMLFDCGDADFELEALIYFALLKLGQLGVKAINFGGKVGLHAVFVSNLSMRVSRRAMSSLVAMCLTTCVSISPSSLRVLLFAAIHGQYITPLYRRRAGFGEAGATIGRRICKSALEWRALDLQTGTGAK